MKNKRILLLGIVLVFFALVSSVVFAQTSIRIDTKDGVLWEVLEGRSKNLSRQETAFYMELYNDNNYTVTVLVQKGGDVIQKRVPAKEIVHCDAYRDSRVIQVKR